MTDRIKILAEKTLRGEMFIPQATVEFDRCDLFLSPTLMIGKRVCEYIDAQEVFLTDESCFTGLIRFDSSVEGDVFGRAGHKNFWEEHKLFYNKPINNLLTFEWQHSVGDYAKVIDNGLVFVKKEIEESRIAHANDNDALEFLKTQSDLCDTIIRRAQKASKIARERAEVVENPEYRKNLLKLSVALENVPENPARSFYEAVASLYFIYGYLPDSIGLIDRYLYPYYVSDKNQGKVTDEEAKAYLQELFLMLQARISIKSDRFYRGGESHFCIGGYLPNGEDGFNELSRLVVEALLDLPTFIPQISLRWTEKTPREVFRFMMESERRDPQKRIAFVNDEPRLKGLIKYNGIPYEEAVNYTMMGCNELALPGGMVLGFDPINLMRSVANTFSKRKNDTLSAKTFDAFYSIYEEELLSDLDEANLLGEGLQKIRSRDINIVSNFLLEGCIKNAKSCTRGGLDRYIAVGLIIGITSVIDSLSVVKQFVFDDKEISICELVDALDKDWQGYETLHARILKRGKFFGNSDETSDSIANRLFESIDKWNTGDNYLGKKWVFGNLIGYNEHNKFFGDNLPATPDGRHRGEPISFGIGQSEGRDREGLTALLSSIARCDPSAILTGPSVTNVLLDKETVMNDESFEKLVDLFETYFKIGGTHFQLTYASVDDMIGAQADPKKYASLRVRVSGFSDYFVYLNKNLQDEIIKRTKQKL